ncbi:MAG TPA: hypothetical protein VKZ43_10010 [Trueperaceae bacterium]|nr:hypothetical protein [Trueperaceae bacterium]
MSEEDRALVGKFKTEWPEEHAAVQRMMDANIKAAVGNALTLYTQQINQVLAPVLASVQAVEVNSHESTILAAHPDAKEIVPGVLEWIETQPTVMRAPLAKAIESGTAQEIVEVLNLYKVAKGQTGAAPATPASSAAQEPQKPAKVPDRKAVTALAAVPAAQRPRQQGADKNDFDAAFAEATELAIS